MSPIYLFDIASQRAHWLSLRQEAIAGNIAHANTPGYAAKDVQPFEAVLQSSRLAMATSDPVHMAQSGDPVDAVAEADDHAWHTYDSGNTVSLEREMVKASEVNSAHALNNGVVKAFHRMLIASAKG
jgi:flagellar basal-body rod protein FlgB